ncbi:ornithine cyclodeaminase family protein [Labedaea rhizosphaerae]|uniref:Ornithine cyclodeaminase n=1 Tax=Labedaea rhizosphaerae TaxID=598644 RepID=A0A4R6SEW4_LABRH|nr:ornithine cyclodeaminase family protein [Labedaea rhizosphaerae]TDQ00502.1 ornithine cyclodeaminase [Labedaea rhizosphaerae]
MTADPSVFRYLSRDDVKRALATIDPVEVITETLRLHSEDRVGLGEEAYLPWLTPNGFANTSLAMQGAVDFDDGYVVGVETVNESPGNPALDLPRAQGLTILLDRETARPRAVMETAYLRALRAATVTAIAARTLGAPGMTTMGFLGCGTQAKAHLTVLAETVPTLTDVRLFDIDPVRANRFREQAAVRHPGMDFHVVPTARDCVTGADLVVTMTTVTDGYLAWDWLSPGTLVSCVSLDDLLPEVVQRCDLLVLDDWDLVSVDHRRLLGRMYRTGDLLSPIGLVDDHAGGPSTSARKVDTTLGEIVTGVHQGRCTDADIVVCNAFGMAALDIAVAHRVASAAERTGLGRLLRL